MNNSDLVKVVEDSRFYQESMPKDDIVLKAMEKVDRKKFIPPNDLDIFAVEPKLVDYAKKLLRILDAQASQGRYSEKGAEIDSNLVLDIVKLTYQMIMTGEDYKINAKSLAYNNAVIPIGKEQTCSQPHMVGFYSNILELKKGMKVLEIGTGCGYHAAVTSEVIGREGKVVSIEYHQEIAKLGEKNLKEHFGDEFEKRFKLAVGDGSVGLKEEAPFDRIYFTAGASKGFDPEILAKQLKKEGGMLIFPEHIGCLKKQAYKNGRLTDEQKWEGIAFVPLVGENS